MSSTTMHTVMPSTSGTRQMLARFTQEKGHAPTIPELAAFTGWTVTEISQMLTVLARDGVVARDPSTRQWIVKVPLQVSQPAQATVADAPAPPLKSKAPPAKLTGRRHPKESIAWPEPRVLLAMAKECLLLNIRPAAGIAYLYGCTPPSAHTALVKAYSALGKPVPNYKSGNTKVFNGNPKDFKWPPSSPEAETAATKEATPDSGGGDAAEPGALPSLEYEHGGSSHMDDLPVNGPVEAQETPDVLTADLRRRNEYLEDEIAGLRAKLSAMEKAQAEAPACGPVYLAIDGVTLGQLVPWPGEPMPKARGDRWARNVEIDGRLDFEVWECRGTGEMADGRPAVLLERVSGPVMAAKEVA